MQYRNIITQITVADTNTNPLYGDCVRVSLQDDGDGPFVVLKQSGLDHEHEVHIMFDEWPNICKAICVLKHQQLG